MKRFLSVVFTIAVLLFSNQADALTKGGTQKSNVTNLIGANVVTYQGNFLFIPTASQFDYYKSKGLTLIRLPVSWPLLQPVNNAALDPTYLADIKTVIGYAAARDMRIIVDLHTGKGMLGVAYQTADFVDFWTRLATELNGLPGLVGYDIKNEPSPDIMPSASSWTALAQAVINGIRTVDTNTAIYLEAYQWSGAITWGTYGVLLEAITDPSNKIVYSAHAYPDHDGSGTQWDWDTEANYGTNICNPGTGMNVNTLVSCYTPFVTWCVAGHRSCHIGETAVGQYTNSPNWLTQLKNGLDYLTANNIQVTFWAAGSGWGNYLISIEPTAAGGGINIDKTQTVGLTNFSGVTRPQYPYISGTFSGSPSTPMPLTMGYNGHIPRDFVLTPSDNGGGGTFSPTAAVCTAGDDCAVTINYTPPGSDIYTLNLSTSDNELYSSQYTSIVANGSRLQYPDFASVWVTSSTISSFTPFAALGPDGLQTAALLVATASAATVNQTVAGAGDFDFGVWAKSATGTNQNFQFVGFSSTDGFLVSTNQVATTSWQCFHWPHTVTVNTSWRLGNGGSTGATSVYFWHPVLIPGSSGACP